MKDLKTKTISATPVKSHTPLYRKRAVLKAAAVIALVAALLCCAVTADAATYYSFAGYTFSLDESKNACIHSYDGEDTELYIPKYIRSYPVTAIDDYAFFERGDFQKLYLESGTKLKHIGTAAFYRCSTIPSAEVPPSVETLGESVFQDCGALEKVVFNNSKITELPAQTFYACASLTEVTLPTSLTAIGDYAFAECGSLTYLELPQSITEIGENAFLNDDNLVLGVWYGSYAFQYAVENSLNCVLLDDIKLGDADGDGSVNINDVTAVQRHLAELERLEGIYLYAADTNQDGALDISDATTLQMVLAEYDIPCAVGQPITLRPAAVI